MQDTLAADIHKYYEDAYDDNHPLYHQLQPTSPYANDSLWAYYHARLQQVIAEYELRDKKVLEVGCGVGFLQNVVEDYIGVDIAQSCGEFLCKPFVNSSVTALPFRDNTFDAVFSIFVLEHVPDPQAMLEEIRRVTKPNGLFFLCAAWNVPPWVSQGYHVRPFSDFDWRGKLTKLTVLPRDTIVYRLGTTLLERVWRQLRFWRSPSPGRLRFHPLEPNFEKYWSSDADACTAIDSHAVWLWMAARGDQCVGIQNSLQALLVRHSEPLLFRIKPMH